MKPGYMVSYHLSQKFNAPKDFVYSWCTDYREEDPMMLGSKLRRRFIERTSERVIWWVDEGGKKEGKPQPIRVVWLSPPDRWHLETCGDGFEMGDYKVIALGAEKTRLDMEFTVAFDDRRLAEASKMMEANGRNHWKAYAKFLERDYKALASSLRGRARAA
jgi:hypothetical protein